MLEQPQKILNELITAVLTILGTIGLYHLLSIRTNTLAGFFMHLPYGLRPLFVMLSPGILAAIVYWLFTKNTAKALVVSITTILLWIFWFSAIYPALIYD